MGSPATILRRLRKLCLSLPETREVPAWGHPNFRAGNRTFAAFEEYRGRPTVAVKLTPAEQSLLVDDVRFSRSPYVGQHGWVTIWVDQPVEWPLIRDLVLRGYRLVARKRMIEALDADRRPRGRSPRKGRAPKK
jgi:predicted DNA-binding protein (MmcQ/YjbR family)